MRCRRVSSSLSRPPMASISFFSSSVRNFSASPLSHSAGISAAGASSIKGEAAKHVAEDTIELVEVALVLHQRGARQIVEALDPAGGQILRHRLHQGEIFAQRHRDAGRSQFLEESHEHDRTRGARLCAGTLERDAGELNQNRIPAGASSYKSPPLWAKLGATPSRRTPPWPARNSSSSRISGCRNGWPRKRATSRTRGSTTSSGN